jgi:hypothetical protein
MWGADSPAPDFGSKTEVAALERHVSVLPSTTGIVRPPPPCPFRATFGSRRARSIISSEQTNEVGRLPIDHRSRSLLVCDSA